MSYSVVVMKAVFAGSFDPPTNGHLNVIERAASLFDVVDVVISVNPNKKYLFSEEERMVLLKKMLEKLPNVEIHVWNGLIVKYAEQAKAKVLVRGIRTTNDFSYEFDLALMNRALDGKIETLFIPTEEKYAIIKSSGIKELAQFGGDISRMVPECVAQAMTQKMKAEK